MDLKSKELEQVSKELSDYKSKIEKETKILDELYKKKVKEYSQKIKDEYEYASRLGIFDITIILESEQMPGRDYKLNVSKSFEKHEESYISVNCMKFREDVDEVRDIINVFDIDYIIDEFDKEVERKLKSDLEAAKIEYKECLDTKTLLTRKRV